MAEEEIKATLTDEQDIDGVIHLEPLRGAQGYSAYELAVRNGYQGTEAEWVDSLSKTNYYKKIKKFKVIEDDATDSVRMDFSNEFSNFVLRETDTIEVKVNGLCLVEGLDYRISSNSKKTINSIKFEEELTKGSIVEYILSRTLVANNEDYEKLKGDRGASSVFWNDEETSGETYLDVIDEFINALPTGIAEGENISVSDSTEYPLLELTIDGKSYQKVGNLNLYDIDDIYNRQNAVSTDEEDYITITKDNSSGTDSVSIFNMINPSSKLKTDTKYYIAIEIKELSGNAQMNFVNNYENSHKSQFVNNVRYNLEDLTSSQLIIEEITTRSDFSDCLSMLRNSMTIEAGQTASITYRISVLEEEPTADTFEYKPFGVSPSPDYTSEIKTIKGKEIEGLEGTRLEVKSTNEDSTKENTALIDMNKENLFDKDDETKSLFYTPATGSENTSAPQWSQYNFIDAEPNEIYTLSSTYKEENSSFEITQFDSSNNWIKTIQVSLTSGSYKFTAESNTKYIRIGARTDRGVELNIKLYKGYTPYYELCSIGDTKDKMFLNKSTNKITQNIGKYIITGNEDWTYYNNCWYCNVDIPYKKQEGITTMCTHYQGANNVQGGGDAYNNGNNTISLYRLTTLNRIYFRDDSITTYEELTSFFSANEVELYYILDTPVEIELEPIKLPKTYKNVSHISTNDELDPNLKVKYLKDIEVLLGGVE